MKKTASNFVIVLISFFLLPITGFLIYSSIELYTAVVSKGWPTTNGMVISSRVDTTVYTRTEKSTSNNSNGRSTGSVHTRTVRSFVYTAVITYKYQHEGIEYQSSNYKMSSAQGELVWVNDLVSQFPANKEVLVYYNPNNPSYALIAPGIQGGEIFMTLFLFFFTILLIFLLQKVIKVKRRQATNALSANHTTDSKEFNDFFKFKLKHILEELDTKRNASTSIHNWKTYRRTLIILLVIVIIDVTLFNKKMVPEIMIAVVPLSVLFAMFYPIVLLYKKGANILPINDEFKKRVMPELISFVNSNLIYEKEKGITLDEFNKTMLFSKATSFNSEDLISGEINGINYRMADIKAKRVNVYTKTDRGTNHKFHTSEKSIVTIFEGLYVIANFEKDFGSSVFVRFKSKIQTFSDNISSSDIAQLQSKIKSFTGEIMSVVGVGSENINQSLEPKVVNFETDNSYFNSLFDVKCENEESTKAIITPAFVEGMLSLNLKYTNELERLVSCPISIFIQGNEVHIALSELNIFDLNAFTTIVATDYTKRYYDLLNSSIELAETLK